MLMLSKRTGEKPRFCPRDMRAEEEKDDFFFLVALICGRQTFQLSQATFETSQVEATQQTMND